MWYFIAGFVLITIYEWTASWCKRVEDRSAARRLRRSEDVRPFTVSEQRKMMGYEE